MTVTSMVTSEPALVKVAPTTWIVLDPAESAAIRALAGAFYTEIERRLAAGSPFASPSGAWQGEEIVTGEGGVHASVGIVGKTIYLRLNTRQMEFGRLNVAERLGRGWYDVYLSREQFDAWIGQFSPPDEVHAKLEPAVLSPAEQVAADLKAQHPELAGRIDKALALVNKGEIEFPHYQTGSLLETNPPTRRCSCPDAEFHAPQIVGIGHCCKHALAQLIAERVRQQAETVAYRHLTDKLEVRRRGGNAQHTCTPEARKACGQPEPSILAQLDYSEPDRRAAALPAWFGKNDSLEDCLQ